MYAASNGNRQYLAYKSDMLHIEAPAQTSNLLDMEKQSKQAVYKFLPLTD